MSSMETKHTKLREVFARFGLPEHIVTDNGRTFTAHEFKLFTNSNGINHKFSPPYHPASNGQDESAVKIVKNFLKKNESSDSETALARFLFDYRTATHSTTNDSPANLLLKRKLRTRFDLLRPDPREPILLKQDKIKQNLERKERTCEREDSVLVRDYRNSGNKWVNAVVEEQLEPVTFTVKTDSGEKWKRHSDQIIPCRSNNKMPERYESEVDDYIISRVDDKIENNQEETSTFNKDKESYVQDVSEPISEKIVVEECKRYPTRIRKPVERFQPS
ncbi:uncharacterized protein K02A2.6-like [Eupeodes corollae]|uniref:uncharacterized protein K02A2.6-like n=1 Tax=Eupeodes corollae TaxID=290404 RepID=UPI00248F7EE3|nr:uncharacterized protein K02A2.6-like [Eupeodes corollae]